MTNNPARTLQSQISMHELFREAKLTEKTPDEFSKVFEKETFTTNAHDKKVVSQKWQRCIDGKTLPNPSSIAAYCKTMREIGIQPKYTNQYSTQKVYASPLWKALKPGKQYPRYWKDFFKSIQPGLIKILGAEVPFTGKNHIEFLAINPHKIREIFNYLNDEALACMLVFMRLEKECEDNWELKYQYYETLSYFLIIVVATEQPYAEYQYALYRYIRDYIVKPEENELCDKTLWHMSRSGLARHSSEINKHLRLVQERGIVKNKKDKADFLYFYIQANRLVMSWELSRSEFIIPPNCELNTNGLLWVIDNMNEGRANDEKIKVGYSRAAPLTLIIY